jgi:hypothetical protein
VQESLKVFNGMLALKEFTIPELSRFSGVNQGTVTAIISRHKDWIEQMCRVETGMPGGQPWRYRLRTEGAAAISERIAKLQKVVTASPFPAGTPAPYVPPLGLRAAADTLDRLFPAAADEDERQLLLSSAQLDVQTALAETVPTSPHYSKIRDEVQAMLRRIDELASPRERPAAPKVQICLSPDLEKHDAYEFLKPDGLIHNAFDKHGEVLMGTFANARNEMPPAVDAIILIVDSSSSKSKRASATIEQAKHLCAEANKPLLVLDVNHDSELRNRTYGPNAKYQGFAAGLAPNVMLHIVADDVLKKPWLLKEQPQRSGLRLEATLPAEPQPRLDVRFETVDATLTR